MVLNNVTKFYRIIIKTIHLREQTSFQPTFFSLTEDDTLFSHTRLGFPLFYFEVNLSH